MLFTRKKAVTQLAEPTQLQFDESRVANLERRIKQVEDTQAELEYSHKVNAAQLATVLEKFEELKTSLYKSLNEVSFTVGSDVEQNSNNMLILVDGLSEALNKFRDSMSQEP
jgi:uncharacterized coiled-coil protein SlyX